MMKRVVEFSVKSPLFVNLISIFLIVAGLVSLFTLQREAFPNISYDVVTVRTDYFGAPPKEVEKLVTIEIEDELKEVNGIDEMVSISSENISIIVLQIDPDATDKQKIVNDIQRAVDRADDLPEDAEDPEVNELQTKDLPVINLSLSGDLPEVELQKYARQLEVKLLDIPDVARIDRMGWRDREIWVEVDPSRVQDDLLSLADIMLALRNQNLNIPGGNLATPQQDFLVRTVGEFETAEEVRNVIIRANDQGNWVRVKDVATVRDTFEDDDLIERTFGHRAINLTVVKKEQGDIIRLVKEAKGVADEYMKQAPAELKLSYFDDFSYYVKRRLGVLKNNGFVGIIFVVLALLIFLSRNAAIMTALGIPIALMTTFFLMNAFGLSINLITMFALIMVLGLVVDDAIVVSENTYRYIERGMPPHEAAIKGAAEVAAPVIVTVATTIVAFIPLFFMSGIMGKYIASIPVVIIIALAASLFECLVILPSHMAESVKIGRARSKEKDYAWFHTLQKNYLTLLHWVIGHRYKAGGIFFATFVFAIILFVVGMKFILFPQGMIEEFLIQLKAPVGTSLEDTAERVAKVEDLVSALSEKQLENYITQVGVIREDVTDPYSDRGSHLAQIHVYLTPEKSKGRRPADDIINELREKSKPFRDQFDEMIFMKVRAGPPVGKPVSIRLRGDDLEQLDHVADLYKARLAQIEGVKDIKDDFTKGKTELRVLVDEEKATKAYLTIRDIATAVRNALDGGVATTIRKTDEEIDVIVRYPEDERVTKDIFNSIYIPNKFQNLVPLNKIAKFDEQEGVNAVKHFDRKRMVNVTADVDEDVVTPIQVGGIMEKFYAESIKDTYPEVIMSFGGEQEETQESLVDFRNALIFAIFMIMVILAGFFNSLVLALLVMFAIPFGIMGVIFAFFLHGQPLSFMAMLGLLGLSGVVVNDSIVLVSFVHSLRKEGMERFDSIIEAGRLRLRPVILTSVTTVVGLMPVAYGIGGSDPFLKPMALAIGWGLAFATVLTLILIPCLFSISDDISDFFKKVRQKAHIE